MGFRKKYIVDGGCPEPQNTKMKLISVHLDNFENEAVFLKNITCSKCKHYFACTFQYEPCVITKKIKSAFPGVLVRNGQDELQVASDSEHFRAVSGCLNRILTDVQKTK